MRKIIDLKGKWKASYDGKVYDKKVYIPGTIPLNPESYPDPESLICYYKKSIRLDDEDIKKRKFLKFYGADLITTLIINAEEVGTHEGGFDSFQFDITDILKREENEIIIKVEDRRIEDLKNTVTGKQDWYGNATGLWQTVELIFDEEVFISSRKFKVEEDKIDIDLQIEGNWDYIECSIYDVREMKSFEKKHSKSFSIYRNDLEKWTPENSKLYDLVIEVLKNGNIIFKEEHKIGFRSITQKYGKIFLNGEPFYMKGLLDQDFYPETHYVNPSKEYLRSQLLRMKALGFNTLRYHVKTPPKEYVELADELGFLLWIDLPYAKNFDSESKDYLKKLRDDLIERYSYSPSFCLLSLINESWGVDLSKNEEMKWLRDFWIESKKCISDRLIVDNSPCDGNHHVMSDLNDYHFYYSYPENIDKWDKAIENFSKDIFVPFKISEDDRRENFEAEKLPKIISEFGVWGLSDPTLWKGNWMDFSLFGIKRISEVISESVKEYDKDFSLLFRDLQWQEFYALKHQIEKIRMEEPIQGFILTELSDIGWEANGILDYSRNDKPFTDYLKVLNAELLPIMDRNGQIYISNISNKNFNGEFIVKFNNNLVEKMTVQCSPMRVIKVSKIKIPETEGRIYLSFIQDGKTVSSNSYKTFNYFIDCDVKVFSELTEEAIENAEKGETVYVQIKKTGKYDGFEVIDSKEKVLENQSLTWDGDWIKGFLIYDKTLLNQLDYSNGGRELEGTFTDKVIVNLEKYDVLIGKTMGWNIAKCAYLIKKKIGKGSIIISTLNLNRLDIK